MLNTVLVIPYKVTKGFLISPKYADDLTFIGTSNKEINAIEEQIPYHLAPYNLKINQTKTEQYIIPAPLPPPPPPPTEEELLNFKKKRYAGQILTG